MAETITPTELDARKVQTLLDTISVLCSGMSNMTGTYFTPGEKWAANLQTGEITYDAGLLTRLDDEGRIGVGAHEIAHLRISETYDAPGRVADPVLLHRLVNIIEDRRIELVMGDEYPGLAGNFRRLRAALDTPSTLAQAAVAEPYMQAEVGVYCAAFDIPFTATHPQAAEMLDVFRDEVDRLTVASSTKKVARDVGRRDGMYEALLALRDMPGREQAQLDPDAVKDVQDDRVANPDAPDGGGPDSGDSGDGPDGDGDSPGSAPGGTQPTDADLAALPSGLDELVEELTESVKRMADLVDSQAGQVDVPGFVQAELHHARNAAGELAAAVHGTQVRIMRARDAQALGRAKLERSADDERYRLARDEDRYGRILDQVAESAGVLGRGLGQVLAENRADRYASVAYRTGSRLHVPALTRAAVDPAMDTVFRRRGRSKNRQYAFAILCDVSGSMLGSRLSQAAYATILAAQAIEDTVGCECAVYAFADDTAAIKPFEIDLDTRGEYLGALGKSLALGGGTQMAAAISRAGNDMRARFDDSWRKVVIVITDGQPGDNPEPVVRTLVRRYDFEFFGIGIKTGGKIAAIFPHWVTIADAWQLTPALMRMMRKAVVRG